MLNLCVLILSITFMQPNIYKIMKPLLLSLLLVVSIAIGACAQTVQPTPAVKPDSTLKTTPKIQPDSTLKTAPKGQPDSTLKAAPTVQPTPAVQTTPGVQPAQTAQAG